jgi:hypothetical protein
VESVQYILPDSPVGEVFIHPGFEIVIVVFFQEMHQFMDENIFQAILRFLGQFQIAPDALGKDVASSPLGFHLLDRPLVDLHTNDILPFIDQMIHSGFKPGPIPLLQH